MANYQNNMRCMRRPAPSVPAPACNMPVAMAYVPWQQWKDIYEPCKALESGTIFAELDKPFLGKGGMRR